MCPTRDVNRQAWNASTSLLVYPSDRYVGLKSDRTFVPAGEPLRIAAVVPGAVRAGGLDLERGTWHTVDLEAQDTPLQSSATAPVPATFQTGEGGTYRITAHVAVAGGEQLRNGAGRTGRGLSRAGRPPESSPQPSTTSSAGTANGGNSR